MGCFMLNIANGIGDSIFQVEIVRKQYIYMLNMDNSIQKHPYAKNPGFYLG